MSFFDGFKDGFLEVLDGVSEAYSEVVTADNTTASPAVHEQPSVGVQATGAPISQAQSVGSWLAANWVLLLIALAALLVLVFGIRWAFS